MYSGTNAFHTSDLHANFFCNLFVTIVELDEQTYPELTIIENRMFFFQYGDKSNVCFGGFDVEPIFLSRMIKEALTNGGLGAVL